MKVLKIILTGKFNRSISTRVAVVNLFRDIDANEVVIDFSDIHLISSSAAHQMVTEVRNLERRDIKVSLENLDNDVKRMLELAKTDRKNIFTVSPKIDHFVLKSESDIARLFSTAN